MTSRPATPPPVVLVARWTGFCLPCHSDERLLVLTWTGSRGVRAWLSGDSWTDGELRLTCTACGGVDAVGWEPEPEADLDAGLDEAAQDELAPASVAPALAVPSQVGAHDVEASELLPGFGGGLFEEAFSEDAGPGGAADEQHAAAMQSVSVAEALALLEPSAALEQGMLVEHATPFAHAGSVEQEWTSEAAAAPAPASYEASYEAPAVEPVPFDATSYDAVPYDAVPYDAVPYDAVPHEAQAFEPVAYEAPSTSQDPAELGDPPVSLHGLVPEQGGASPSSSFAARAARMLADLDGVPVPPAPVAPLAPVPLPPIALQPLAVEPSETQPPVELAPVELAPVACAPLSLEPVDVVPAVTPAAAPPVPVSLVKTPPVRCEKAAHPVQAAAPTVDVQEHASGEPTADTHAPADASRDIDSDTGTRSEAPVEAAVPAVAPALAEPRRPVVRVVHVVDAGARPDAVFSLREAGPGAPRRLQPLVRRSAADDDKLELIRLAY